MSIATNHVEIQDQPQFSFGPDDSDIKIQIPVDLKWNTVQAWVDKNTKLFSKIANPYKKFLPAGTDAEDLKSMAYLAAFSAIEKASANDRLDDFVPFFCRIYKTEIMKQAKGVPVVSLVELPVHELEGVSHDSALENVRFDREPGTEISEDEVIVKSLDLLTTSQKQFVAVVLDSSTLSVAQIAKKLDILPASVHNRVKVISKRIHLKRENQKPTRARKQFMVKSVSDQKNIVPNVPEIFIDIQQTKPNQPKKYFTVHAVSDHSIVRLESSSVMVEFKPEPFCTMIQTMNRPAVTKNARKGDTFLATRHKESPSRVRVLHPSHGTISTSSNRQQAPPGRPSSGSTDHNQSSGRSSPTKGGPFVYRAAVFDSGGGRGTGGHTESESHVLPQARASGNQARDVLWDRTGFY